MDGNNNRLSVTLVRRMLRRNVDVELGKHGDERREGGMLDWRLCR